MNSLVPIFGGLLLSYGWTRWQNEYFYNPKESTFVIGYKFSI